MENKYRKEHEITTLERIGKIVKHFIKETSTLEDEAVNFHLEWPIKPL